MIKMKLSHDEVAIRITLQSVAEHRYPDIAVVLAISILTYIPYNTYN